jgi:3-methyladenine DNA glycosylase AlkD
MTSEPGTATRRAEALVAARLPAARALGDRLQAFLDDPDRFERELERGFRQLADPAYAAEQARVAPGVRPVIGVRWPLVHAVESSVWRPLRGASAATSIYLAERLGRSELHEVRLFALVPLRRALVDDPERAWQLLRRLARRARDWITVDTLAELYAAGILREPYRWAEIEQLVYSPHSWERRLVAAALARLPHQLARAQRSRLAASGGLMLIESMIGDDAPEVQKALSWALRNWAQVDRAGTVALIEREARRAAGTGDGHRAWVVRDSLAVLELDDARALRELLSGIRRQARAPSTSRAHEAAAALAGLPDAHTLAEAPLSR